MKKMDVIIPVVMLGWLFLMGYAPPEAAKIMSLVFIGMIVYAVIHALKLRKRKK